MTRPLIRILTVDSVKDLFRYKSFFLLVFLLITADRVLHRYVPSVRVGIREMAWSDQGMRLAAFVFDQLPPMVVKAAADWRVAAVAAGLFALKQLISMWPSSDMRRMHRHERERFGIIRSLTVLRWRQIAWDAVALMSICAITAGWLLVSHQAGLLLWKWRPTIAALLVTAALGGAVLPLTMAGFSYSSKLAVLSGGFFTEKLGLFFSLLTCWRILLISWLFFTFRMILETVFVALIPAGALVMLDSFWLRLLVASLSATPVYAYLKMATFKFFLMVYEPFPLVRAEYRQYYAGDPPSE